MNSDRGTMKNGQPISYWRYRYMVSIGQILIVVALITIATLWAVSDGNGQRLWEGYLQFSQGVSEYANTHMKLPWE